MSDIISLRTENGKMFDAGRDAKSGRPSYTLEARTGPIHYKEAYKDTDPWLDLDESYSESGEIKGIGKVLVYPKLPNIVTVFQDRCGYQIQSRSNPDHVARVELVSIDGQNATAWQDSAALKTSVRVHPYRVGIWKDFSAARKAKATTMRWKVTELGNNGKDSHPFAFREVPEAYNTADLATLDPAAMEQAKVTIETARTRIDDISWYWDELIPAEAKLVDTDWQIGAGGNDGYGIDYPKGSENFRNNTTTINIGRISTVNYQMFSRFTNITVQKGSTVTSCTHSVKASANRTSVTLSLHYCFYNYDNVSAPTTWQEVVGWSLTDLVQHDKIPSWTANNWYSTYELKSIIQTVFDRAGWSSGNAVGFRYRLHTSSPDAYRTCYSYETSSADSPKLSITWTEPTRRGPHIYVPNVSWLVNSLLKRREI